MSQYELFKRMVELKKEYKETGLQHWYSYEFGKWQWWLSVVMTFLPLYIWWKIVDRKRIFEIISYGMLVNIVSTFLDTAGSEFALWEYPIRVVPVLPHVFPFDYVVVPVSYMIVYQYFRKWKQFIIANTVMSFVFSFVAEHMLEWIGLYRLTTWKHIYSFPIYIAIAIVCKWVINWFEIKELRVTQ